MILSNGSGNGINKEELIYQKTAVLCAAEIKGC